jgi:hypothetical protein
MNFNDYQTKSRLLLGTLLFMLRFDQDQSLNWQF